MVEAKGLHMMRVAAFFLSCYLSSMLCSLSLMQSHYKSIGKV